MPPPAKDSGRQTRPPARPGAGAAAARPRRTQGEPPRAQPGTSSRVRAPTGQRPSDRPERPRGGTSDRAAAEAELPDGASLVRASSSGLARPKGMGLRLKFMLILSVVTGLAMTLLGVVMFSTTNKYLFGQKVQDGIELARMVAQLGHAAMQANFDAKGAGGEGRLLTQQQVQDNIARYLETARKWENTTAYSDIEAVTFNCPEVPELHGEYLGREVDRAQVDKRQREVFIPKAGRYLALQDEIQVYSIDKQTAHGTIPIYRFKIQLGQRFGAIRGDSPEPAHVRVDISAESVSQVRNNLLVAIILGVLFATGAVVAIANWLALNITKPLDLLLKDMQNVARGDLDHETKPRSTDEIGVLAYEFNRMTKSLKVAQAAQMEQEKAEHELSLAREVQRHLLPAEAPTIPGFQCDSFYQGAKAVSGDYFDFIPLGNGLWGFAIADVSGKGIPGSMVMAVTRTIIRLIAYRHQANAAETLKETNRLIAKQIKRGMFVTCFYAVLDQRSGHVVYASAGHNPMVIYRAATRTYELAQSKGIALGFNEGPIFDKTIQQFDTLLAPGDGFVLYTDGFPEAMSEKSEEFGDERFYKLIGGNGHLEPRILIQGVVGEIAKHRGKAEQSDDLTMLVAKRI